jgi:hypothetical protein
MKASSFFLVMAVAAMAGATIPNEQSVAAAGSNTDLEFGDDRELSYECEENGRTVHISQMCCDQTQHVQSPISTMENSMQCEQINAEDFKANIDHYCRTSTSTGGIECVYDVKEDNQVCESQTRDLCHKKGGKVFASDYVIECEEFSLEIRNSLSCMGASCTTKENQEFLWVGYFTNHDMFTGCQLSELNGESLVKRRHDDAVKSVVGTMFGVLFIGLYLYVRYVSCFVNRRRQHAAYHQPAREISLSTVNNAAAQSIPAAVATPVSKVAQIKNSAKPLSAFDSEFV